VLQLMLECKWPLLNIVKRGLSAECVVPFCKELPRARLAHLEALMLSDNQLGDAAAAALGQALAESKTLLELSVDGCCFTDTGLLALVDGLRRNSTLSSVGFGDEAITDESLCDPLACLLAADASALACTGCLRWRRAASTRR
jgi:Ran GTPase-activating protein (RanGAP) involved in mRNA processing and transport